MHLSTIALNLKVMCTQLTANLYGIPVKNINIIFHFSKWEERSNEDHERVQKSAKSFLQSKLDLWIPDLGSTQYYIMLLLSQKKSKLVLLKDFFWNIKFKYRLPIKGALLKIT